MSEITTPRELFLHELGDILYVEKKLAQEVLPQLISETQHAEFRRGLEKHLNETRKHVENVKQVFETLGENGMRAQRPIHAQVSCFIMTVCPGPPPVTRCGENNRRFSGQFRH